MSKKRDSKSDAKTEVALLLEEAQELGLIMDRLAVQSPDGESFKRYLESLRNTLIGRESLVAALIDKLSRKPSEVGFQSFLRLQDLIKAKKYSKLSKQAAYRFTQKGFSLPIEEEEKRRVVLVQKESRESIAHMTPMREAFWFLSALVQEEDYLDPIAISAYVDVATRTVSARAIGTSNKAYREYLQKISRHFSRKPVEIPIWHAARLLREMTEFFMLEIKSLSQFERAKKVFQPFDDPQRLPYAYELIPVMEVGESPLGEASKSDALNELVESMPKEVLLFSKEEMEPYWHKFQELERPVLVIPGEVQKERGIELMEKAANELCVGKTRLLFQRFFEEEAMWQKLSGHDELAAAALSVARHLQSDRSAASNPLIPRLAILSMHKHWQEEFSPTKSESEHFQQTDSGLIIP